MDAKTVAKQEKLDFLWFCEVHSNLLFLFNWTNYRLCCIHTKKPVGSSMFSSQYNIGKLSNPSHCKQYRLAKVYFYLHVCRPTFNHLFTCPYVLFYVAFFFKYSPQVEYLRVSSCWKHLKWRRELACRANWTVISQWDWGCWPCCDLLGFSCSSLLNYC